MTWPSATILTLLCQISALVPAMLLAPDRAPACDRLVVAPDRAPACDRMLWCNKEVGKRTQRSAFISPAVCLKPTPLIHCSYFAFTLSESPHTCSPRHAQAAAHGPCVAKCMWGKLWKLSQTKFQTWMEHKMGFLHSFFSDSVVWFFSAIFVGDNNVSQYQKVLHTWNKNSISHAFLLYIITYNCHVSFSGCMDILLCWSIIIKFGIFLPL